jgi:putative RecB family exonuclease
MLTPPEYLSPSSIATFQQCPLKYKYSRIDGLTEPPTEHTLLGNFVHSILENFYALPPEERTLSSARGLAAAIWPTYQDDVSDVYRNRAKEIQAFRWKAWWCVENLMKMEDPQTVVLSGIETELYDKIDGVLIKGFVDRYQTDETSITIGDYKTGKVPRPQWARDKFDQLLIYGIILSERLQKEIGMLELLYVAHSERLQHSPTAEDIQDTKKTIKEVRTGIDMRCESGVFEPVKTTLCGWCTFKSICPAWK